MRARRRRLSSLTLRPEVASALSNAPRPPHPLPCFFPHSALGTERLVSGSDGHALMTQDIGQGSDEGPALLAPSNGVQI